jgi:hypothetical protein
MSFRRVFCSCLCSYLVIVLARSALWAQAPAQSPAPSLQLSSSSTKQVKKSPSTADSKLDSGTVRAGVYGNAAFGFACKIPAGWVLRTEEMNTREDQDATSGNDKSKASAGKSGRVLLAAFSRPPEARAEDVNASILIAAESAAAYPGLKEAAQYFGPLTEVTKAQGFETDGDPYALVIGSKTLARGDFHKDVGTRVMRQSTLVILARGYVVSFTFIGGTDDEVAELIQRLSFASGPRGK